MPMIRRRDSKRLRVRLKQRSSTPEVSDLYRLMAEAESERGRVIEQPWFLIDTFQSFALTVEFEPASNVPVWSLYEALDEGYRMLWSCRDTDVYLLHDVLSMFMAQSQPRTPVSQRAVERARAASEAATLFEGDIVEGGDLGSLESGVPGSVEPEVQAPSSPASEEAAEVAEPDGQDYADTAEYVEAVVSDSDWEEEAGAPVPGEPVREVEPVTEEGEGAMLPGGQAAVTAGPEPPAEASAPERSGTGYFDNLKPGEMERLKEQPNVLLGHLLVECGAIPEALLEAALKLQEMVRTESLTPNQAVDAMFRTYKRTVAEAAASGREAYPVDASEGKGVAELLYEAGIVSNEDVKAVTRLTVRPGGELDTLRATGKIDTRVQELAVNAFRLMRKGQIKHEQAVIALSYSFRMHLTLHAAFTDLGWEFPY